MPNYNSTLDWLKNLQKLEKVKKLRNLKIRKKIFEKLSKMSKFINGRKSMLDGDKFNYLCYIFGNGQI